MIDIKTQLLLFLSLFLCSSVFSQGFTCDPEELNVYIVKEVNRHRKKAKAPPLYNDALLGPAGEDHCRYMTENDKLTHDQKNKLKRTPKNRVDFYGEQFDIVGENIQQTFLHIDKKQDIQTCEDLAKVLVAGWRSSPGHYANMIDKNYTTTFTTVQITDEGKVYACQLFGSDAFKNTYRDSLLDYIYQPASEKRCKRCDKKYLIGGIQVMEDGTIMYQGRARFWKTKYELRRPRFNLFQYGIAADIVLKEQYDCDTNIVFNGKPGVRGIPIEPVFKKTFQKGKEYILLEVHQY